MLQRFKTRRLMSGQNFFENVRGRVEPSETVPRSIVSPGSLWLGGRHAFVTNSTVSAHEPVRGERPAAAVRPRDESLRHRVSQAVDDLALPTPEMPAILMEQRRGQTRSCS